MQEFYEQIEKLRSFEDHYINKVIGDLNAEINQRQVDKIVSLHGKRNTRAKKRESSVLSEKRACYHGHLIPTATLLFPRQYPGQHDIRESDRLRVSETA